MTAHLGSQALYEMKEDVVELNRELMTVVRSERVVGLVGVVFLFLPLDVDFIKKFDDLFYGGFRNIGLVCRNL